MRATSPLASGMTILFAPPGKHPSKAFKWTDARWQKTCDYDAGFTAHPLEHTVGSIEEMHATISEVAMHRTAFLVRGGLTEAARARLDADPHALVNRCSLKQADGRLPDLLDVDRDWMMVDVDHWRLPPSAGLDVTDPDDHPRLLDLLIHEVLHPSFHDVSFVYQFSGSCGPLSREIIKVHLFYRLAQPAANATLRRLAETMPQRIDHAPFNPSQPHYVAPPRLTGGHDPIPCRIGLVHGEVDLVTLPEPSKRSWMVRSSQETQGPAATATPWLASVLATIGDGDRQGGFHAPTRSIVWTYARHVVAGSVPRNDAKLAEIISRAVRRAPRRDDRPETEIARYADPGKILRDIEQAILKAAR